MKMWVPCHKIENEIKAVLNLHKEIKGHCR